MLNLKKTGSSLKATFFWFTLDLKTQRQVE